MDIHDVRLDMPPVKIHEFSSPWLLVVSSVTAVSATGVGWENQTLATKMCVCPLEPRQSCSREDWQPLILEGVYHNKLVQIEAKTIEYRHDA